MALRTSSYPVSLCVSFSFFFNICLISLHLFGKKKKVLETEWNEVGVAEAGAARVLESQPRVPSPGLRQTDPETNWAATCPASWPGFKVPASCCPDWERTRVKAKPQQNLL